MLRKIYKSIISLVIKKIEKILFPLAETPFSGEGKPEQLKHDYQGYWSRRLNQKDRIIYRVEEETVMVFVVSAMGHYENK